MSLFVLAGAAVTAPAGQTLVVADADTGEELLAVPVADGTTVTLAYTHSVERTPIRDVYTVQEGQLVMTRMEFESYGWGLPAGADVRREHGTFVFDPDEEVETLSVKPGRIAGHTLHVGDRTYDLVALSDARSVRITLRERSTVVVAREVML